MRRLLLTAATAAALASALMAAQAQEAGAPPSQSNTVEPRSVKTETIRRTDPSGQTSGQTNGQASGQAATGSQGNNTATADKQTAKPSSTARRTTRVQRHRVATRHHVRPVQQRASRVRTSSIVTTGPATRRVSNEPLPVGARPRYAEATVVERVAVAPDRIVLTEPQVTQLNAAFTDSGLVCSAGTRLIVHESIAERFVDDLVERAGHIVMGGPFEEHAETGPLISAAHRDKVTDYVQRGIDAGARLRVGGHWGGEEHKDGYFYAPTVLADSGPLGRWGPPAAEFVFNSAMAMTLGALLLAVVVVLAIRANRRRRHAAPPESAREAPDRALLLAGLTLVQLATGNRLVRLVLVTTGALPAGPVTGGVDGELRGGRLLGPLERLFILGLGLAGELTAAGLVIAAKGLIRWPELRSHARSEDDTRASDIDKVTEYFLVGSFVSWLVALGGLLLAA